MATRVEVGTVYATGVLQGLALVTFPAASGVLTDPTYYGLSASAYGGLFLPQAVMAVVAALAGAALSRRLPTKPLLVAGLAANVLSMALLLASQAVEGQSVAYPVLLLATALLGIGFGLTVPAINTLAAAFFPATVDRAILVLNALLGLGTTLAPVLVAVFVAAGAWWGLPAVTCALLIVALLMSVRLPLRNAPRVPVAAGAPRRGLPRRFWVFAAAALVYGIVETMNGNWATIDMTDGLGATATAASLALTAFWGMVTVGRLAFAALQKWIPPRVVYRVLPFVLAVAFVAISRLQPGNSLAGIAAFGLAGLACSAMLPLTISFGEDELTTITASVAAGLIAAYQVGYGIAAYGVGPLESTLGVGLSTLYLWAAIAAVILGLLAFVVVRPVRHSPSQLPAKGTT